MKFLAALLILGSLTNAAYAEKKIGSRCGLTNSNENWQEISSVSLSELSESEIQSLPMINQRQVRMFAEAAYYQENGKRGIHSIFEAIEFMSQEYAEPYIIEYKVNGKPVTEIRVYSGETEMGVIYQSGYTKVLAENSDQGIYCIFSINEIWKRR